MSVTIRQYLGVWLVLFGDLYVLPDGTVSNQGHSYDDTASAVSAAKAFLEGV